MNDKFIEICRYCNEPFGATQQIYRNLFTSYKSILWCLTNLSKFVVFQIVDSAIGIILKRLIILFVAMFVLLTFCLVSNLNNNNELKRQQPITLTERDDWQIYQNLSFMPMISLFLYERQIYRNLSLLWWIIWYIQQIYQNLFASY